MRPLGISITLASRDSGERSSMPLLKTALRGMGLATAAILLRAPAAFAQDAQQPHWLIQHSWAGALAALLLVAGIATAVALHRAGRRRDLLVQSFDTSSQARQLVGPGG